MLGPADQSIAAVSIPHMEKFTELQGQYLAFIHTYDLLHGRPPAETDMQAFFRVSPPSVHRMVIELETRGLIRRQPRTARSIEILLPDEEIPQLRRPHFR